ncbi:MAG: TatD family hydrolase [Parcubacteria group bacterium]|nr:TatD family hydrolase [Parcubacteria group bacterium]
MNHPLYFDAHSHINDPRFDADLPEVLARMKEAGVWSIVVGTEKNLSERAVELARANEGIFSCVGLHPTDDREEKFDETLYHKLASDPKTLAKKRKRAKKCVKAPYLRASLNSRCLSISRS